MRRVHAVLFVICSLILAGFQQDLLISRAVAAEEQPTAADGGLFTSASGRLLDTRGSAKISSAWTTVPVQGVAGLPTSGIKAVAIVLTAVSPASSGYLDAAPAGSSPSESQSFLNYVSSKTTSNSAVVKVGSNGAIQVRAGSAVDVIIDIQGFYSTGRTAAGGYVPVSPVRVKDTRQNSSRLASGATVAVALNQSTDAVASSVPASASAAVVNITVINPNAASNFTVTPGTSNVGGTSYVYTSSPATAVGLTVPLNAVSGVAKFSLRTGTTSDYVVDVVGYFTPPTDSSSNPGFVPSRGRVLDSRVSGTALGADSSMVVTIANATGSDYISSSATVHIAVVPRGVGGFLNAFRFGDEEPNTTVISYQPNSTISNTATVAVDQWGRFILQNHGSQPVDVVVDLEGFNRAETCWEDMGQGSSRSTGDPATYPRWAQDTPDPSDDSPNSDPLPASDDESESTTTKNQCATQASRVATSVCFLGIGQCGMTILRYTGTTVHVSYDVKKKIGDGKHKIPSWLLARGVSLAQFTRSFTAHLGRTPYTFTVWEYQCDNTACSRTSRYVNMDIVIDWKNGKAGDGNLITMYCSGYYPECPSWVQSAQGPYFGPPGPQYLLAY